MKIIIQIPDNAVKMFVDLVDALRTIAKTVEVETKDDGTVDAVIQEAEQLKKEEGAKKVKRNLDAFQKLADDVAPKVTLEQVRAKLAELTRNGKREQVKALLNEFGANKLSEVPADKYAKLMEKAEEIA